MGWIEGEWMKLLREGGRYEVGAGGLRGVKKDKKNWDEAQCLIDKRPNLLSSDRREVIEVTSFISGCYTQILKKLVAAGSTDLGRYESQ